MTITRVLIANRGEIAVRIIRACEALGIETVLAVSDADRDSLPARLAHRTICIGPASATASYLNIGAIVTAALGTESDAVHPGYGFLAESHELAKACADEGITFVGPSAAQIRQMGNKLEARALAKKCGLPVLSGSDKVETAVQASNVAARIGLPVMLKAAAAAADWYGTTCSHCLTTGRTANAVRLSRGPRRSCTARRRVSGGWGAKRRYHCNRRSPARAILCPAGAWSASVRRDRIAGDGSHHCRTD